ncbi:hypothetical protein [Nitratifractor sp.]|uniref:hypothetical protein n=1 Tax=Nitratifractor sp. TaxID=2268144 RepID=UPI0025F8787E|nr:hypothetical protein [Nitratifractor sp.]
MKKIVTLAVGTMLAASALWATLPGQPARSSYIGKRFMAFEMNNGPSYKWKKLADGGSLQWWRSDLAGCCVGRYESGIGNRCELLIKLDAQKVIKQIRILDDGSACNRALR